MSRIFDYDQIKNHLIETLNVEKKRIRGEYAQNKSKYDFVSLCVTLESLAWSDRQEIIPELVTAFEQVKKIIPDLDDDEEVQEKLWILLSRERKKLELDKVTR